MRLIQVGTVFENKRCFPLTPMWKEKMLLPVLIGCQADVLIRKCPQLL